MEAGQGSGDEPGRIVAGQSADNPGGVAGTAMAAALPAVVERMPNGDLLMHAIADFVRPNGERVEGRTSPSRVSGKGAGRAPNLCTGTAGTSAVARRTARRWPRTKRALRFAWFTAVGVPKIALGGDRLIFAWRDGGVSTAVMPASDLH